MKKSILFLLMLCLSVTFAYAEAEWTVMVYIAGDNNLDSALVGDVNEMEAVGSDEEGKFNIIVFFDRWSGEWVYGQEGVTKTNEDNSGMKIYYIQKDTNGVDRTLRSKEITEDFGFKAGMINSGDPKNLEKFIKGVVANYPAKNYHLDIGTHGAGVKGVIVDDNAGSQGAHSIMAIKDLRNTLGKVFGKVVSKIAGEDENIKLNVISFDACLMGMYEVDTELGQNNIGYVVSSEEVIPGYGYTYNDILEHLKGEALKDGGLRDDGKTYTEYMVDSFYNAYNGKTKGNLASVSVQDLAKNGSNEAIAAIFKKINESLNETDEENVKFFIEFHNALYNTVYFSDDTFIDLEHFIRNMYTNDAIKEIVGEDLFVEALAKLRPNVVANKAFGPSDYADNIKGISIYLPYYYRVQKDGVIRRRSTYEYAYYMNGFMFAKTEMGKEINSLFSSYVNAMETLPDSAFGIQVTEGEAPETATE